MTLLGNAPHKKAILLALRYGAMNLFEISEETGIPPFTVRAELKDLRRLRLVADELAGTHLWNLTPYGCGVAWSADQLEIV